jgi:hypothetical protein
VRSTIAAPCLTTADDHPLCPLFHLAAGVEQFEQRREHYATFGAIVETKESP